MVITSRKLSATERRRQYWPMFERWVAAATLPGVCSATATGLTRKDAERNAERQANDRARAKKTQRTTTR